MKGQKFHFIGIGGIGMSALARILLQRGFSVQGSDSVRTYLTDQLIQEGAHVSIGHKIEGMEGCTVIYSSAVSQDNVEWIQAQKLGLPMLHRSELLDALMKDKRALLVTGTHGKTTTTALLASVFLEANQDPSFVVGGVIQSLGTNGHNGQGLYFVAEADESDGSFLRTRAFGAIATNCEKDHLDYWGSSERLQRGFQTFFSQVIQPEHLFWCKDDPSFEALSPPGFSYGFASKADLVISRYRQEASSILFDILFQGKLYKDVEILLSGFHNALNAAAVFGLCLSLGLEEAAIRSAFRKFQGVKRRLEWKGEERGVACFDDYGHHPTEIRVTVKALKQRMKDKRLVLVFQPHRFSRTKDLWSEFITCFEEADLLILTDIYSAGEKPIEEVSGEKLFYAIQAKKKGVVHFFPRSHLAEKVASLLQPEDVVLTMGAGDITQVGNSLLNVYASRFR